MMRVFLCLFLVFTLPVSAREAEAPAPAPIEIKTNRQVLALIDALIWEGRHDEAVTVIGDWQPDHPDHAMRVRYVEGRVAAARGENAQAVKIFRSILAGRPDLEQVRLSLAAALYRMGEDDAARYQAEQLIAAGVDDRAGGALQSVIKSIDARRPLQFNGYASLLPSTNINGGAERGGRVGNFVILDEDARQSGIGGLVGGQVIYRKVFAPELAFVATADGTLRHYPDIDRTLAVADVSVGVEKTAGRARLLPSLIAGFSADDFEETRRHYGLRVEASTTVAPAWRFFTAPSIRDQRVAENRAEDGLFYDIPLQIDRFVGANRFGRLILGHSGARKDADRFSYDEWRIGLGAFSELPYGITLYAQGSIADRRYGGDFSALLPERRRDRRWTGVLALTKRDLAVFGFAPRVTYIYERNVSNIAFHDTTRHDFELRFTKEF